VFLRPSLRFDSSNLIHRRLAELGKISHEKVLRARFAKKSVEVEGRRLGRLLQKSLKRSIGLFHSFSLHLTF